MFLLPFGFPRILPGLPLVPGLSLVEILSRDGLPRDGLPIDFFLFFPGPDSWSVK